MSGAFMATVLGERRWDSRSVRLFVNQGENFTRTKSQVWLDLFCFIKVNLLGFPSEISKELKFVIQFRISALDFTC
jgi:hypothetical protein